MINFIFVILYHKTVSFSEIGKYTVVITIHLALIYSYLKYKKELLVVDYLKTLTSYKTITKLVLYTLV